MAAPSPFSPSMKAVTAPSPSERTTARTGIESVLYHAALQPLKSAAAVCKSAAQHERDATGLRAPPAIAAPPVALALVLLPERIRAAPARPGLPVLSIGHNAWKSLLCAGNLWRQGDATLKLAPSSCHRFPFICQYHSIASPVSAFRCSGLYLSALRSGGTNSTATSRESKRGRAAAAAKSQRLQQSPTQPHEVSAAFEAEELSEHSSIRGWDGVSIQ